MKSHRIALLLGQDLGYCRGVLSGILDYAEHNRLDWTFRDGPPTPETVHSIKPWKPEGIIAHIFDRKLALTLAQFNVPVINVTLTLGELPFPVVDVDHRAVGKSAADYFLSKGFHSFAYFGSDTAMFSRAREQGFVDQLKKHKHSVDSHYAGFLPRSPWNIDWEELDSSISNWLQSLPKPVAILASNDIPARHLATACRKLNYRIPEEVSILGVDNDDSECRMTNPYLSSIALPTREIGKRASEILHEALLKKQSPPSHNISIPPLGIIERQSTDQLAIRNAELERLLRWIQNHIQENPSVTQIATRGNLSRRTLERIFHTELGMSVLQFKIRCRLEKAKDLLRQTEMPIERVSEKSGFTSPRSFTATFRKLEHLSPSAYRKIAS